MLGITGIGHMNYLVCDVVRKIGLLSISSFQPDCYCSSNVWLGTRSQVEKYCIQYRLLPEKRSNSGGREESPGPSRPVFASINLDSRDPPRQPGRLPRIASDAFQPACLPNQPPCCSRFGTCCELKPLQFLGSECLFFRTHTKN